MEQSDFEKKVVFKLLDYDNDVFRKLKKQYLNSMIIKREFTGCGFFTYFLIPDELRLGCLKGEIHDVIATLKNSPDTYVFRLVIDDGMIDVLEGFSMFGEWKKTYDDVILSFGSDNGRYFNLKNKGL